MVPKLDLRRAVSTKREISVFESASSLVGSSSTRVCGICTTEKASYTCPRCFMVYCSLKCYKNHGEACTEEFSRDKVRAVLSCEEKGKHKNEEAEDGHEQINKSNSNNDEKEEEDIDPFVAAIMTTLEDNDFDAASLTHEQQRYVRRMLAAGMADGLAEAEICTPWWVKEKVPLSVNVVVGATSEDEETEWQEEVSELRREVRNNEAAFRGAMTSLLAWAAKERALVAGKEQDEGDNDDECAKTSFRFGRLPNRPRASEPGCYHVLDFLLAYVAMLRQYNACWPDDPAGALTALLLHQSSHSTSYYPASVHQALEHWWAALARNPSKLSPEAQAAVLADVHTVLKHPFCVAYALVDGWLLGLVAVGACAVGAVRGVASGRLPREDLLAQLLDGYASTYASPLRTRSSTKGKGKVFDKFTRKMYFLCAAWLPELAATHSEGDSGDAWPLLMALRVQLADVLATTLT